MSHIDSRITVKDKAKRASTSCRGSYAHSKNLNSTERCLLLLRFTMGDDIRHAIVYGASGLIGWSVVDQLLNSYPTIGTFSKVTAVTNRPLNVEKSCWPEASPSRPRLQLVSGVDLQTGNGDSLAKSLQASVKDIETVTHIFYLGELKENPETAVWLICFVCSIHRHGR